MKNTTPDPASQHFVFIDKNSDINYEVLSEATSINQNDHGSSLSTSSSNNCITTGSKESKLENLFNVLFSDLSGLKMAASLGQLENTNLRTMAWMVLMGCLPIDTDKWAATIDQNRAVFTQLKKEICCDPHQNSGEIMDHPLSESSDSDWNKYFLHNEMKSIIYQDVIRINQDSEIFNYESTRETIINLLFIYVEHVRSEYRQGMHEILACIMHIVHDEYKKLESIPDLNKTIKHIANLDYFEHDSFTLFKAVMRVMHDWFGSSSPVDLFARKTSNSDLNATIEVMTGQRLFRDNSMEQSVSVNKIINKINHIANFTLKNNDIEIYNHLNQVDVSLHPFGIRWLRLLFLRELEFPFCLVIWDAIFATDNKEFKLADYVFVALLISLRNDILKSDNSGCMRLLMQPNYQLDPLNILQIALYLYDPIYSRPASIDGSFEIINPSHNAYGMSRSRANNRNKNQGVYSSPSSSSISSPPPSQSLNSSKTSQNNLEFDFSKLDLQFFSPSGGKKDKNKSLEYPLKMMSMQEKDHNVDKVIDAYIDEIKRLQQENLELKTKAEETDDLCERCSVKMNISIELLQKELAKKSGDHTESDLALAIVNLKQVRDELDPNLRSQKEQNEEVIQISTSLLADQSTEQQIESLNSSPKQSRQGSNEQIAEADSSETTTQFFKRRLSSLIKTFAGSETKDDGHTLTRSATDLSISSEKQPLASTDPSPDYFDSNRRRSQSLRYPLTVQNNITDKHDDDEQEL